MSDRYRDDPPTPTRDHLVTWCLLIATLPSLGMLLATLTSR